MRARGARSRGCTTPVHVGSPRVVSVVDGTDDELDLVHLRVDAGDRGAICRE